MSWDLLNRTYAERGVVLAFGAGVSVGCGLPAEPASPSNLAHLGPIDFAVFRRSLPRAENEPIEVLQSLVPLVRGIAAAHNQAIPADVEAWFARMSG